MACASSRLAQHFQDVQRFVEEILLRERAMEERDYDGVEAELKDFARWRSWTYKGFGDDYAEGISRDEALEQRDEVKADLEAFIEDADADLAARLQEDLGPAIEGFEQVKEREGKLDFLDLLIRVRDMIRDHDDVRVQLQERFTHFFVDEFQDTDPLQVEILMLLASSDAETIDYSVVKPVAGKLFIVGDPKQSIYRFRRADVMLYDDDFRLRRHLLQDGLWAKPDNELLQKRVREPHLRRAAAESHCLEETDCDADGEANPETDSQTAGEADRQADCEADPDGAADHEADSQANRDADCQAEADHDGHAGSSST